ncbi:ATP-dependent DNA helicase PIF1 [Anthonomus grandis grandis]|uniref:ATP-dependent DNA helicase PIF1 n=1 Tax=Anthonomus grandis grandis TaxID=2921223 RepID=UPI00216602BC|nr:ATP-dependent DNA helicase PIF1 [Anthonomus grandis grandis]
MEKDSFLCCEVNIQWLNKQGLVQRKVASKKANLRLLRGDTRDVFIEVVVEKAAPVKLKFSKGAQVHNRFMAEGKSSLKFPDENASLFLSNAPPEQLKTFLKTLFIKMANGKPLQNSSASLRTQVLSHKSSKFEEISPVTNGEMDKAFKKVSGRSTETTPSPLANKKRKIERSSTDKAPAAKKLYSGSPVPTEQLDMEQREVLQACISGQNVFFTGSAGTGKSFLLRKIIGALPPDVTIATASTGVAACHIGGITLHQFAGIGGGDASLERSVEMASKPPAVSIWRKCKHLIIDEISMVDGVYFEKIEEVARRVRRNEKPFGGIQLILCGDFFQLPPVTRPAPGEKKSPSPRFCFMTEAWRNCRLNTFELKQVHRQTDNKFITVLNKIRFGKVDEDVVKTLTATSKQKIEGDGILATRLCSHTKDADIINESKLKALGGETKIFEAQDLVPGSSKQLDMQTTVPGKLELKIGAQVMLLKNINLSAGLVNGARGIVKLFRDGLPLIQFKNKKEYLAQPEQWIVKTAGGASLTRKQVPLRLAWAFSIHKSQGLTLDCVEMSLGRVFEAGQAYVALSRARSLDALRVLDFNSSQVWANPDVISFYKSIDDFKFIPLGPVHKSNIQKKDPMKKKSTFGKSKLMMDKPLVTIC